MSEGKEMTDKFYYFICPECGYDSNEAKFLDKYINGRCPLCAGDTGRDVWMRYREATPDEVYLLEIYPKMKVKRENQ